MTSPLLSHSDVSKTNVVLALAAGLLAVWNLPHTIALRYGLALILLIVVFTSRFDFRQFRDHSRLLTAFMLYLLVHLTLLSDNFMEALDSFRGEWLKFIVFAFVGWGAGSLLSNKNPLTILLGLGTACCIPLIIHLTLTGWEGVRTGAIPWGYWGINKIHGDLGYTALCASVMLSSLLLFQKTSTRTKTLLITLLLMCILSPIVAKSRGGFAFVVLVLAIMLSLWLVLADSKMTKYRRRAIAAGITASVITCSALLAFSTDTGRWSSMITRLELGYIDDPIQATCQGLPYLREEFSKKGITLTPDREQDLYSISDGDGLRALLLATGLQLVPEYPLGINGSKNSYQTAIAEKCTPAIQASHLHNGWLDTSMAIGIPGALLYLCTLLAYTRQGWRNLLDNTPVNPYSAALFAMSVVWILRSLADSAQRDQMLEMQIFLITFLSAISLRSNQGVKTT